MHAYRVEGRGFRVCSCLPCSCWVGLVLRTVVAVVFVVVGSGVLAAVGVTMTMLLVLSDQVLSMLAGLYSSM